MWLDRQILCYFVSIFGIVTQGAIFLPHSGTAIWGIGVEMDWFRRNSFLSD
jgi:hypothetical protein